LRGCKGNYYEGGIRVPLVVRWPGAVEPGSVCRTPVISHDFHPTLLEMAGRPPMPEQHTDGVSLVPLLKQSGDLKPRPLFWHFPNYIGATHLEPATPLSVIRDGDWKLIEYLEDGRLELFDLAEDLGETNNLANEQPERAAALHRKLTDWRKTAQVQMPQPNPDYTARTKIGSRLELFVDHHLIERLAGEVELKLHRPVPREVVLVTDRPWEGNTCAYYTVFQDGDVYRMYYRGSHFDETTRKSAHASGGSGELLTKPLVFDGKELQINFSTARDGMLRVEMQDLDGDPIDGFRLDDCPPIRGDDVEHTVAWRHGKDLGRLSGTPVRLRFRIESGDLYSFSFRR
jgi:hypothetical protein